MTNIDLSRGLASCTGSGPKENRIAQNATKPSSSCALHPLTEMGNVRTLWSTNCLSRHCGSRRLTDTGGQGQDHSLTASKTSPFLWLGRRSAVHRVTRWSYPGELLQDTPKESRPRPCRA